MKTSLFIDTTILIRYTNIGEIDFKSILGTEDVEILIPINVINELDKHKDSHKNIDIRNKARKWLKFFDGLELPNFDTILKNKITLKLITKEPKINFDDYDLDSNIPDDRIIANLIGYRDENKGNSIVLVSRDSGIKIKAKLKSFKTITLDQKYELKISEDKQEKEIRRLKLENSILKNRIPKLDISFKDKTKFKKHEIETHPLISSSNINKIL